ncbi:PLCZ1 isoform 18, partial [Pan troglodytes]
ALNFQTPGLPMDLQNGKFLDNGGSGYILKPHFLRESKSYFNPSNIKEGMPITLTIRLISGIQLPLTHSSSNKGYRRIPLFSRMGESLEPASLFVYVWYVR